MSNEGVFAVHRGVFKHEFFADEPYTEREAWLWLVGNAVWKPTRARVKDSVFDLARGQCAYSIRFLAVQWKWSKSRAARFLDLLKIERMIDTQAGRDATLITICNYDQYQLAPGHRRDANQDAGGTQAGRRRDKEEEDNKIIKEESAAPRIQIPSEEADLFRRGKQVLGDNAGGMITKLKSAKGTIALARAAIETASTKENPREYIGAILRGADEHSAEIQRRYKW